MKYASLVEAGSQRCTVSRDGDGGGSEDIKDEVAVGKVPRLAGWVTRMQSRVPSWFPCRSGFGQRRSVKPVLADGVKESVSASTGLIRLQLQSLKFGASLQHRDQSILLRRAMRARELSSVGLANSTRISGQRGAKSLRCSGVRTCQRS